jgi:hypothetical protein
MTSILTKISLAIASLLTIATLFGGLTAQAQYGGGTTIFPGSGTTGTTTTTGTSTTGTTTNNNFCPATSVSSSVSGETVTVTLCKVKAGNTISINNLNTPSIDSVLVTFNQDLDNGVFQIVKIPQSLTYPNLPGNYITAFELLTTNFNRNIIQSITLNFKVSTATINQNTNVNAYISSSPWVSTAVTRTSQDSSFTRYTSTTGVFTQYALTATTNTATRTETTSNTNTSINTVNDGNLIRTGESTSLITYSSLFVVTLLGVLYTQTRKNNLFKSVSNSEVKI